MTTLRGPDPYALAEERLASVPTGLTARARDAEHCRILQETIPTFNYVALYRPGNAELDLAAWAGSAPPPPRLRRPRDDRPRIRNDLATEPTPPLWAGSTRAEVLLPFATVAGRAALLVASDHRGAFGPADLALLRLVIAALQDRER